MPRAQLPLGIATCAAWNSGTAGEGGDGIEFQSWNRRSKGEEKPRRHENPGGSGYEPEVAAGFVELGDAHGGGFRKLDRVGNARPIPTIRKTGADQNDVILRPFPRGLAQGWSDARAGRAGVPSRVQNNYSAHWVLNSATLYIYIYIYIYIYMHFLIYCYRFFTCFIA